LRQHHEELVAREAKVLVLGPDKPGRFRGYWKKHELPFIGLPDPEHVVLKLYGQEVNLFKLGRMPATVLIDKSGVVRLAHYGRSMGDVTSTHDVLAALDESEGAI
jgi:peroxiredoxin Q/BCP